MKLCTSDTQSFTVFLYRRVNLSRCYSQHEWPSTENLQLCSAPSDTEIHTCSTTVLQATSAGHLCDKLNVTKIIYNANIVNLDNNLSHMRDEHETAF